MITLSIKYKNGDYREVTPPESSVANYNDLALRNDSLIIDDIENNGVIWQCSYLSTKLEEFEDVEKSIKEYQIVKPENLQFVSTICLNNKQIYPKKSSRVRP